MGRRGFQPAPTAEKLAKGERRPSRVNYDEPQFEPPKAEALRPPSGLDGAGLREWKRQIDRLAVRGVLTEADLAAFEDYCRALSQLRSYELKAKRAGLEQAIAKGFQNQVLKLRAQVNILRRECGLTPSSRGGVRVTTPMKLPETTDPAERYLRAVPGGKS